MDCVACWNDLLSVLFKAKRSQKKKEKEQRIKEETDNKYEAYRLTPAEKRIETIEIETDKLAVIYYLYDYEDDIVIPDEINGKKIVSIDKSAFKGKKIKTLTLPKNLLRIEDEAFANATIKKVILPETLKKIGDKAFAGSYLNELIIPSSVEVIGEQAFFESGIKTFIASENLREIGKEAFKKSSLSSIDTTLYQGRFQEGTFSECSSLRKAIINVKSGFPKKLFYGSPLVDLHINFFEGEKKNKKTSNDAVVIKENCFSYTNLKEFKLPIPLEIEEAFVGCRYLERIELDHATLNHDAFGLCPMLKVAILNNCIYVHYLAFYSKSERTVLRKVDWRGPYGWGDREITKYDPIENLCFFTNNPSSVLKEYSKKSGYPIFPISHIEKVDILLKQPYQRKKITDYFGPEFID